MTRRRLAVATLCVCLLALPVVSAASPAPAHDDVAERAIEDNRTPGGDLAQTVAVHESRVGAAFQAATLESDLDAAQSDRARARHLAAFQRRLATSLDSLRSQQRALAAATDDLDVVEEPVASTRARARARALRDLAEGAGAAVDELPNESASAAGVTPADFEEIARSSDAIAGDPDGNDADDRSDPDADVLLPRDDGGLTTSDRPVVDADGQRDGNWTSPAHHDAAWFGEFGEHTWHDWPDEPWGDGSDDWPDAGDWEWSNATLHDGTVEHDHEEFWTDHEPRDRFRSMDDHGADEWDGEWDAVGDGEWHGDGDDEWNGDWNDVDDSVGGIADDGSAHDGDSDDGDTHDRHGVEGSHEWGYGPDHSPDGDHEYPSYEGAGDHDTWNDGSWNDSAWNDGHWNDSTRDDGSWDGGAGHDGDGHWTDPENDSTATGDEWGHHAPEDQHTDGDDRYDGDDGTTASHEWDHGDTSGEQDWSGGDDWEGDARDGDGWN